VVVVVVVVAAVVVTLGDEYYSLALMPHRLFL
jgi:hypothetical protein